MSVLPARMADDYPDVLEALRSATGARHGVLDRAMPLSKEQPTLADYRDHLLLLKGWLAPIESWLAGFSDGPQRASVLQPVTRAGIIDADLADPATPASACTDAAGNVTEWPRSERSAAYRWGVGYVIEGSQLGGAVLYRRLHEALAPHPLHYLAQRDMPAGPRWRHFVQAMRSEVQHEGQIEDACAGAVDAFDRLIALVSRLHAGSTSARGVEGHSHGDMSGLFKSVIPR
ncbi:biliverdin-producing heme oxygenase [Paraburkholderia sp. SOS3]|uniref:biliverdin-producing heme oxygenase n=1 Tax=Paraburkholderia sp. SOS3 TaxID=1926494 RepID=UPI0012EB3994|nr:biliverdin-producing heme oxygenase [Paraburkholderia sp. SOS3]